MSRARELFELSERIAGRDPSHPIPAGSIVMVHGAVASKVAFSEGLATVQGHAIGSHRYWVKFLGDPVTRERFIHPDCQNDPERALILLRQLWRFEQTPVVADFFPDA